MLRVLYTCVPGLKIHNSILPVSEPEAANTRRTYLLILSKHALDMSISIPGMSFCSWSCDHVGVAVLWTLKFIRHYLKADLLHRHDY